MGQDKATLRVGEGTLIGHTYAVAKKVFTDIMVVSSLHESIDGISARMVHDVLPIPGSLTGIATALLDADTPYVFVLGCDMPFLTPAAILYTIEQAHGEHLIIPRTEGGFEPLHAIYHRSCLSPMLTFLERGRMKIGDLFGFFCVRTLPPNPLFFNGGVSVFTNVNTREDLNRAERALG
jgi:molybdopterin-guanine dinucleotide biosynthesis protein A